MSNPFTSDIFVTTWMKHFKNSQIPQSVEWIEGLRFVKHRYFPFYVNVGKNLTKGVSYSVNAKVNDFEGKTLLVYDVPTYFNRETIHEGSHLKLKKVFQYQGFLMDLTKSISTEAYINSQFSSKNRREFRSNERRLHECFSASHRFFYKDISKEDYNFIFDSFYELLSARFSGKNTNYHHLEPQKWNYYKDLVYPMIKAKKASFLVIYDEKTPIGITLNFHSESVLFETITVFDTNYSKFSIGKLSIIKLLDFCYAHKISMSDFSKGDFDYKRKWGNTVYDFNYHILYDASSVKSKLTAFCLERFFKAKLYLREKEVNQWYRKMRFKFARSSKAKYNWGDFKIEKLEEFHPDSTYKAINFKASEYKGLLYVVYSFLFYAPQSVDTVKVYQDINDVNVYVISGDKKAQKVIFNH